MVICSVKAIERFFCAACSLIGATNSPIKILIRINTMLVFIKDYAICIFDKPDVIKINNSLLLANIPRAAIQPITVAIGNNS